MVGDMQRSAWMCWGVSLCVTAAALAQTASRPAGTTQPAGAAGVGTVKGNNVYIRSGFSTNYYPVTKLNAGDAVKIVSEETGWLEIESPSGTFSLVDKNFVDKLSDKKGVVNGTVQVYAGSNMENGRYAKQVKLPKGSEVQLLGETSDSAFYKIEPPPGAHVWVKAEFIDRSGASIAKTGTKLEPVPPGGLSGEPGPKPAVASNSKPPRNSGKKPSNAAPLKPLPSNELIEKYQMQINAIETEVAAESTKPINERQFEPIIARLQPIAEQTEDEISQIYAKTRIEQLKGQMELAAAVKQVSQLRENTVATADEIARERENIRTRGAKATDTIVVKGEIRASGIYDGAGNRPKRWRIVDTAGDAKSPKTIAYLEVPEGSPIDPAEYYGKFVGIRATSHKFLKGTIPPVPIYQVREIVLNPTDEAKDDVLSTKSQSASPVPVVVTEPTSQPSAEDSDKSETTSEPASK